jgi:prepilin signal peptidase PulO-like enzyme (type II secretory pathway)
MSDTILISVYLAVLGLIFGSFANAAVWRLKKKKDIVKDRSECIHCHHKLSWMDLIPVLSWVLLRGKCRYCKKNISPQYPLVELAVAAYFVGSFLFWPTDLSLWYYQAQFILWLIYGVGLAVLFVYDLRWFLLPDRVVYPLIGLGLIDALIRVSVIDQGGVGAAVVDLVLSVLAIGGFYGALYFISKGRWIGFGDVKLGVFMGLVLGWEQAIVAIMVANVVGFLVILPGLLTKKLSSTSRVPFGPYLIIGFIAAGLFGHALIDWYLTPFSI